MLALMMILQMSELGLVGFCWGFLGLSVGWGLSEPLITLIPVQARNMFLIWAVMMIVWGRVCVSTATWLVAAGPSRGKVRRRRVLGPVGTGPRLERRSLYKDLGSFPLHRLRVLGGRATPERGQMLRRAVCETASNVYQPRPASPDRGHGVRRDDWGRRSEFASSFDSPSRAPLGL